MMRREEVNAKMRRALRKLSSGMLASMPLSWLTSSPASLYRASTISVWLRGGLGWSSVFSHTAI